MDMIALIENLIYVGIYTIQFVIIFSHIDFSKDNSNFVYKQLDLANTDLFNLSDYEEIDMNIIDPNEKINREKLNLISAHFILNDSDLEVTKRIVGLFQKLNAKWSFLVNKKLNS